MNTANSDAWKKRTPGLHEYRFSQSPEERRFTEAWAVFNHPTEHLRYLLDPNPAGWFGVDTTHDQRVVAATVIQWLGSPVGQCFLRDLGYEKKQ
jgi:hypothetical protein